MRRYKQGFDRLGIVAFVVCAAIFALIYLAIGEPYSLPDPASEAGQALTREITEACGEEGDDPFAMLCRDQVLSKYEWKYYRERIEPTGTDLVVLAGLILAAAFLGPRAWRWVRDGFRQE